MTSVGEVSSGRDRAGVELLDMSEEDAPKDVGVPKLLSPADLRPCSNLFVGDGGLPPTLSLELANDD